MILVGHSHSECAFNDSLIDGLANFACSGESYFYTYYKTRKLIEQNPQVNTIFIEFTNNQIDRYIDDWIWDNDHMPNRFSKYALFMDKEGYKLLYQKNPSCFKKSLIPTLRNNFIILYKGLKYTDDLGGYRYLDRDKTDSLVAAISDKKISKNIPHERSIQNIEYLSKLVKYCENNNVKVFLFRSPLHEKYGGFHNEQVFQNLLSNEFSNLEFLDFAKFSLPNSEFGDLQHLNFKGAKKFSVWFDSLLRNGLLKSTNKQAIIDNEIKERKINKQI